MTAEEKHQQYLIDSGYIDGKKSFEHLSKEIHDNFDWERVHTAMKAVDWVWYLGKDEFGKDNMGIPSIATIKNHAYAHLKKAYDEEVQTGSGGFTAGWDNGELYLTFTLAEESA